MGYFDTFIILYLNIVTIPPRSVIFSLGLWHPHHHHHSENQIITIKHRHYRKKVILISNMMVVEVVLVACVRFLCLLAHLMTVRRKR